MDCGTNGLNKREINMEAFFVILFILICFGSLITTFVAIIQILTNEFNGSKGMWVLISMIAIIGPVLYLTKGRKLIVKK
jgi:hypothetical protein